jgi:hypothetical protein
MNKQLSIYFICSIALVVASCKKQDQFLDAKPNDALAIPTTLNDVDKLLRNESLFNQNDPSLGMATADEYYVPSSVWTTQAEMERNAYIFAKDVYNNAQVNDWEVPYRQIYNANTALDALKNISAGTNEQSRYNQVKGTALFFRSYASYNLLQTFALPYDSATANTDLGIPLRLNADLNVKSTRPSIQTCYNQVISDLKTALELLPVSSDIKTQPNKVSANALLARIYLAVRNYTEAFNYSNASLTLNNALTDFNTLPALTSTATRISTTFLNEDIFHAAMIGHPIVTGVTTPVVDSSFYALFNDNDLRKSFFFTLRSGAIRFRGTYDIAALRFSGLANDEVYLIRAECQARKGNKDAALADLNTLLSKRWKTGFFTPVQATSSDQALVTILLERRKELCFRGLRWTDIRRLNKENNFKTTVTHIINGTTYTLTPNDPKYALPIPSNEIQLSGLQQNPR